MLKKVIKYKDFDGNDREDAFYFNLTRAECMELEVDTKDGMERVLKEISNESNPKLVYEQFKKLVSKAYGEKSADGLRFYKSDEIAASFAATEAYSELLIELATNADAASEFVNKVIPQAPNNVAKPQDVAK